jgi:uncharacterized protein YkuJ
MTLSLHTLPIELVYCILDNLDVQAIFLSLSNVCQRLNTILDTHHRYQVKLSFSFEVNFNLFRNIIYFVNETHFSIECYDRRSKHQQIDCF